MTPLLLTHTPVKGKMFPLWSFTSLVKIRQGIPAARNVVFSKGLNIRSSLKNYVK